MARIILKCIKLSMLLPAMVIAACGGGGNNDSVPTVTANPDSALLGVWDSPDCNPVTRSNSFHVYSQDGSFQFTQQVFQQHDCTDILYTFTRSSNFVEGSEIVLADGRTVRELDYGTDTRLEVTPRSSAGAQVLNSFQACGNTDWTQDVTRDVNGCDTGVGNIEFLPLSANFDIYEIVDNHYLFFSTEISFTAANRPTQLLSFPTYIRRQSAEQDFPALVAGFWQVQDNNLFFEMRENSVIFAYTESDAITECFLLDVFPTLRTSADTYVGFAGTTFVLEPANEGLDFTISFPGSQPALLMLERNEGVQASDLVLCELI